MEPLLNDTSEIRKDASLHIFLARWGVKMERFHCNWFCIHMYCDMPSNQLSKFQDNFQMLLQALITCMYGTYSVVRTFMCVQKIIFHQHMSHDC